MTLMIFHRVLIACAVLFLAAYGTFELLLEFTTADPAALSVPADADVPQDLARSPDEEDGSALITGFGMIAGAALLSFYFVWLIRQPLPESDAPPVSAP